MSKWQDPPPGWVTFGSLIDAPKTARCQLSEEVDECGMPLFERIVNDPVDVAWNDPLLEWCETAPCPCMHKVIDHDWTGCDECQCTRSPTYALLCSGMVKVERIDP